MQSESFIRFVQAFYNGNTEATDKILKQIISSEKKLKHYSIVSKLEDLMQTGKSKKDIEGNTNKTNNSTQFSKFMELPRNPRNSQPLASIIAHDKLRHNMILDEVTEDRFLKIEKEFSARNRLANYNLKPKRRILLYGPPGCGKTTGAERIARNIGLPLLKVNFDSLISSFLGETSSNLRSIFDITKKSPCVLLLDECDIIAKSRIFKQDVGEMSRIVNMLLTLLDEYNSEGLVIATTNLEETLDKAIYRRFDDIIQIKLPNTEQILKIIKNTLAVISASKDLNYAQIIEKLQGKSAASIVAITENAIKGTILSGQKTVSMSFFEKAISENYIA